MRVGVRELRRVLRLRFLVDLFLEQRTQHDRGDAGLFEPLATFDAVAERRGTGDERVRQRQAEILGREIHGHSAAAGWGSGPGAAFACGNRNCAMWA